MVDTRIKELIDLTKLKCGLEQYYLYSHKLYRLVNSLQNPIYTLSMEWFPSHITEWEDEDCNPEGTATIDIDVNSRRFERVIFVGGKSYANGNTFCPLDTQSIIQWVENETGLRVEEQFQLLTSEKGTLHFQGSIHGIPLSPSAYIDINFDEEGRLTLFSVYGHFPSEEEVWEQKFSLTLKDVESIAKEQLQLTDFPVYEQERIISVYCIEEMYVTNERVPFDFNADDRAHVPIDEMMHWQSPLDKSLDKSLDKTASKPFKREELNWDEQVTPEQAFLLEPHPDTVPISRTEQVQCIAAVRDFLRQVFPDDTGKWVLKTLHREVGYILATLKQDHNDNSVLQRKLLVFLDAATIQAINYMDNKHLVEEMIQSFEQDENKTINKKDAFEKLKPFIELKPVYVYDANEKHYRLCGAIDCQYAVRASDGEVIPLYE